MIDHFEPGEIPFLPPHFMHWDRDVATYERLYLDLKPVLTTCLSPVLQCNATAKNTGRGSNFLNPTGYTLSGEHRGIGLFIWGTGSVMDMATPANVDNGPLIPRIGTS